MAEERQPFAVITLRSPERKISVKIYRAREWADACRPGSIAKVDPTIYHPSQLASLYRLKVDRKWWPRLPRGRYKFFSMEECFLEIAKIIGDKNV